LNAETNVPPDEMSETLINEELKLALSWDKWTV